MRLVPYLQFKDGKCREALAFYGDLLGGGTVAAMTFGEAPGGAPVGPEWQDMVMHAHFEAGGLTFFACDAPPQFQQTPQGIVLMLGVDTPAEAERVFAGLAKGGAVSMAMTETFWAQRFGMLADRYGMPWMVSCDKPAP